MADRVNAVQQQKICSCICVEFVGIKKFFFSVHVIFKVEYHATLLKWWS